MEEGQQAAPPQNPPADATQAALQAMMGQMARMAQVLEAIQQNMPAQAQASTPAPPPPALRGPVEMPAQESTHSHTTPLPPPPKAPYRNSLRVIDTSKEILGGLTKLKIGWPK